VYTTWADTLAQVHEFPGAQYKSFPSRAEAEAAYRGEYADYKGRNTAAPAVKRSHTDLQRLGVSLDGIAVDAACAGVPGPMEYRGVSLRTGEELFRKGPYPDSTNNVGEFLAIVHALAWLDQQGDRTSPVYSDSRTAIAWVQARHCRTKLEPSPENAPMFALVRRAEAWLRDHPVHNPVEKWETGEWGEVPADFGRK
jgi:ribonuclease HI